MNRFVRVLSLVALLAALTASYFVGKRFRSDKYFLYFTWSVHTADEFMAGTDSNIRFSFGFLKDNKLVWFTERMPIKIGDNHFERGDTDKFHEERKGDDYGKIEAHCDFESKSFEEYRTCITQPNVVFLELQEVNHLIWSNSGGKIDKIELKTVLQYWRKGAWAGSDGNSSVFRTADEFPGKGGFFIRRSEGGGYRKLERGWPVLGRVYKP